MKKYFLKIALIMLCMVLVSCETEYIKVYSGNLKEEISVNSEIESDFSEQVTTSQSGTVSRENNTGYGDPSNYYTETSSNNYYSNDDDYEVSSRYTAPSREDLSSRYVTSSKEQVSSTAPDPCYYGHTWEEVTEIVHHEEQGEYQWVSDSKKVLKYDCPCCSSYFYGLEEYYEHFDSIHTSDHEKLARNIYNVIEEWQTSEKKVWVVTQKPYDEEVVVGYVCSVCGEER